MKKTLILFLLITISSFSQVKLTEIEKYKQIGLVWGLLKYHHPEISKGKYNWDLEFLNLTEKLKDEYTQENLNNELLAFINKFDISISFKTNKIIIKSENIFKRNINYQWIDSTKFGLELAKGLNNLKHNNNIGDFYVSFDNLNRMLNFSNEKGLDNFNPLLKSHRLLELFSFWNIIQYWYVNKYLIDEDWIDIIDILMGEFLNANSISKYEIAKLKMLSKLNDSHSYKVSSFFLDSLFNHYSVFSGKIINDSLVVTSIFNKSFGQKDSIGLGDVIVGIDNLSTDCPFSIIIL